MIWNNWNKVTDKLPEIGSVVLTYPGYVNLPFGNLYDLENNWSDNDFWEYSQKYECIIRPKNQPTHWMEIPKLPEPPID